MRATDLHALALAAASACTGADYELGALVADTDSGSGDAITDDGSGTAGAPFVDPLDGAGPIKIWVDSGIASAVGGVWDQASTALLVADAGADAILRVTLAGVTPILTPAGNPRALAFDVDDMLLVAEANSGRLVRVHDDTIDVVTDALGSPTSIAVASTGHRYVTDADAGTVHRVDPDGLIHLEIDGLPAAAGIAVADDAVLYIARRGTGEIRAAALGPAGEVVEHSPFAEADTPVTSICVDEHGNVLAVGDAGVHAFRPDGTAWGSLPTEVPILDCSFGLNGSTEVLFLVAATSIYLVRLPVTGAP